MRDRSCDTMSLKKLSPVKGKEGQTRRPPIPLGEPTGLNKEQPGQSTEVRLSIFGGRGVDRDPGRAGEWKRILGLFDVVIESSRIGVRKPETRFFELACDQLGIVPNQAVYLDDLGTNLKPARMMGMHTIKVEDPAVALAELELVLKLTLH